MTELQLKIIINAAKIRICRGENPATILDSYPKLSPEERERVMRAITVQDARL